MRMGRGWMLRRLLFLFIWGGERKVVRGNFVRIAYPCALHTTVMQSLDRRPQVDPRRAANLFTSRSVFTHSLFGMQLATINEMAAPRSRTGGVETFTFRRGGARGQVKGALRQLCR